MAATIKTIQRPDKKRDDGTCPIYIRVTVARKTTLVATKIYVPTRDWNPKKGRVRAGHDLADAYNARIDKLEREALELGLDAVSAVEVKQKLLKGTGQVQHDIQDYITELTERDQEWERKKFLVLAGKLEACFGSALTWEQLDTSALVKFEKHLRSKLSNSNNTIRSEMKRLRRLFKRALTLRTVRADQDPFLAYARPKETSTDRRKLTLEEMKALESLELPTGLAWNVPVTPSSFPSTVAVFGSVTFVISVPRTSWTTGSPTGCSRRMGPYR
jgi:Arm DNA-binding domain/Phage integrase SAM-like domain